MKKIFLSLSILFVTTASAFAIDLLPQESPSNRRVRNLGMGNVGVSILGNVDSSAFYNPAGLNDIEKGELRFLNITGEVSKGSIGLVGEIKDLKDNIDAATNSAGEVRALNDFIQEHTGDFQHLRLSTEIVSYTRKNLAVGLMFDERLDLSFRDQTFPHFDMRNLGDVGTYIAFSQGYFDQLLQVGMNFRPMMRFSLNESDQQITFADATTKNSKGDPILVDQFKNIYQDRQFVIPVDFGLKSNLAFDFWKDSYFIESLRPQVGVTWDSIGSPSMAPLPTTAQTVNAGFSINPKLGAFRSLVAVEMRELNRPRPLFSKLHAGAEVSFPWALGFAVRAGLSQGYYTAGASIDLRFLKIDTATYAEEVGYYTRQSGNRRYAVTLGFKI